MPQIVLCNTVEYHQLSRWMKSKSECAFLVAMTPRKRRRRSGSDLREAVAEFSAFNSLQELVEPLDSCVIIDWCVSFGNINRMENFIAA